jgi:hypothetical protein
VVTAGRWKVLPGGDVRRYTSAEEIKAGHDAYLID